MTPEIATKHQAWLIAHGSALAEIGDCGRDGLPCGVCAECAYDPDTICSRHHGCELDPCPICSCSTADGIACPMHGEDDHY